MTQFKIVEQGKKDKFNTTAYYAACWTDSKGRPAGSSWRSLKSAEEIAAKMQAKGREGVFIKKNWFAGFVI